jgi:tRNA uridine 5-carbamoylmethylation protein Kti12
MIHPCTPNEASDMDSDIPTHNAKRIQASVLLLCGLPGSGKSTISRSISEHYQRHTTEDSSPHFHKVVQIEYDVITNRLAKDRSDSTSIPETHALESFTSSELEAWREARIEALDLLRKELSIAQQQSGMSDPDAFVCQENYTEEMPDPSLYNILIIMDDNFHLRSMRRDVYKVCQTFVDQLKENTSVTQILEERQHNFEGDMKIGLSTVFVNASLDTCIVNNEQRLGTPNYIPQRIITNMHQTMEVPDGQKAKFELCSMDTSELKVNTQSPDDEFFSQLKALFLSSISQHPVVPTPPPPMTSEEIEKERLATLQSTMHQVDLVLRAFVGVTCRTNKTFSKAANMARKSIITEFKEDTSLIDNFSTKGNEAVKMKFEKIVLLHATEDQSAEIKLALCKASI